MKFKYLYILNKLKLEHTENFIWQTLSENTANIDEIKLKGYYYKTNFGLVVCEYKLLFKINSLFNQLKLKQNLVDTKFLEVIVYSSWLGVVLPYIGRGTL